KDLIIIRGRNFYPQDIEEAVGNSSPLLGSGRGAAFSLGEGHRPRLVLVHEVVRGYKKGESAEIFARARQGVAEQFELELHTLVLVRPASIPRSSSGKIQRRETCRRFEAGSLEVVEAIETPSLAETGDDQEPTAIGVTMANAAVLTPTVEDIRA